jgi:hypothetical protein
MMAINGKVIKYIGDVDFGDKKYVNFEYYYL